MDIVLCLEFVKDWSIGTAPSSHNASWSGADLAEKFQRVPHAFDTIVRDGDRNWERRRERQFSSRRIFLKKKFRVRKTDHRNKLLKPALFIIDCSGDYGINVTSTTSGR